MSDDQDGCEWVNVSSGTCNTQMQTNGEMNKRQQQKTPLIQQYVITKQTTAYPVLHVGMSLSYLTRVQKLLGNSVLIQCFDTVGWAARRASGL